MLCILCSTSKDKVSLIRLGVYDHISLHAKANGFHLEDIHPANPSFSTELFCKNNIIKEGLFYMSIRGLVDIHYTDNGVYYSANSTTHSFIACFHSEYFVSLKETILDIAKQLDAIPDSKLEKEVYSNYIRCPGEIEVLLKEGDCR